MKKTIVAVLMLAIPSTAFAQVSSPVTQVQGPPTDINRGNPVKTGCVYNSAAPTANDTRVVECQADVNGNIKVVVGGNTATGASASQVQGNVAGAATDSGNPVKIGCKYNTSRPTYTDGQRTDCQSDTRGAMYATLTAPDGGSIATANGLMTQPYGNSSTNWSYSSGTSPILSNTTTAVTIKTAAGASVINYIDSCQIGSTALGASVPLALRDGAGGTVKFAVRPPTAGWLAPWTVNFQPPLKGTANTLWEVVTTTADTSGTFDVNCQGHTGS